MSNDEGTSWLDDQLEFVDVQLSGPIRVNGRDVTQLRIREPVAKDLRASRKEKESEDLYFQLVLSRCARVSVDSIGMLRLKDYEACAEALASLGFTEEPEPQSSGSPGSQETGKSS